MVFLGFPLVLLGFPLGLGLGLGLGVGLPLVFMGFLGFARFSLGFLGFPWFSFGVGVGVGGYLCLNKGLLCFLLFFGGFWVFFGGVGGLGVVVSQRFARLFLETGVCS